MTGVAPFDFVDLTRCPPKSVDTFLFQCADHRHRHRHCHHQNIIIIQIPWIEAAARWGGGGERLAYLSAHCRVPSGDAPIFFFICSCPPRWFHASVLRLMMFTHKKTHTHTHAHAHTRKNSHIHTNRIIIIHYPSLLLSSASPFVQSFSSLLLSSANKTDGWMDG